MWCKSCNLETNEDRCPICGIETVEDVPVEIYWCDNCSVPLIHISTAAEKGVCPLCGNKTHYLSSDLRPVFPEERLLLAVLLEKEPTYYMESSIWAVNSRYYIDGATVSIPIKMFAEADTDSIARKIAEASDQISYTYFDNSMAQFIHANKHRLAYLKDEAFSFVRKASEKYKEESIVISFSGGKDSTVTADIVTKALSNPSLVHIFGNTTLEFPSTIEYARRYREAHPLAIFQIAKNDEQVFYDVCEDIGPPARMMRWCCSMFKTGPITRVINSMYRSQQILTFYGIRKSESVSRSKYNRIEDDAESVKIQQQTVASPIFFWKDIDIWLYMIGESIDFNSAYRLGYDRVGCWCCPNNNQRAQFLSRIYMPEESKKWRDFLVGFAKKIGKPDPEVYVDSGKWKARQGGNGLASAGDVKIRFTNCTTEDHAKIYRLVRPYDDELIEAMGSELCATVLQTALCAVMGAGFAAASVIWELDTWSLAKQSGIYFLAASVIMLPIAYVAGWMKHTIAGFLSYTGIFAAIFVAVWLSQYLVWKLKIKKMNGVIVKDKEKEN